MEADWAAEVGPDLPVIEADWAGYIDLRAHPEQAERIEEAAQYPALREALLRMNAPGSPVRTTKCDVWPLATEEIDPLEFGCAVDAQLVGLACYIDVVAIDAGLFGSFALHEPWVVAAVRRMRVGPPSQANDGLEWGCPRGSEYSGPGRVDLVIRAVHAADSEGFGVTLYAAGCGVDAEAAQAAWTATLRVAAAITMGEAPTTRASSSIG